MCYGRFCSIIFRGLIGECHLRCQYKLEAQASEWEGGLRLAHSLARRACIMLSLLTKWRCPTSQGFSVSPAAVVKTQTTGEPR